MKVAVLADIHGNLPALETVVSHIDAWGPDKVIVAGDVVNRGPRPFECLRFVQARQDADGWQVVRGNHEEYVLYQSQPDAPRSGPRFEIFQNSYWTLQQLNGEIEKLEAMPFQVAFPGPDGREVRIVHASMRGSRDGIFPMTPDSTLRQQIAPPPAVLCVGHTHVPLVRKIDQTLVVNVGAVGMPFDRDSRASYAQLSWRRDGWQAEIVRLEYDRRQAQRDYFDTGFVVGAGDLARLMLVEFHESRSHLHLWIKEYEDPVLAEQITMAESVRDYLASTVKHRK